MGFLLSLSIASRTFFSRCSSTKGPFFNERGTAYLLREPLNRGVASQCSGQSTCSYGLVYPWSGSPRASQGDDHRRYDPHHHRGGDRWGSSQLHEPWDDDQPNACAQPRSEERRVGKDCTSSRLSEHRT